MHKITSTYDLIRFLEARRVMAQRAAEGTNYAYDKGLLFGLEESIKAVQALIDYEHANKGEK